MSFRYFSLWWINDVGFTASEISWVQTVAPLVGSGFMPLLQNVAKRFGRAQTSLLFSAMSIPLLVGIARMHNVPILLILYFLRTGFLHGSFPIQSSILMDFTPSSQRG